MICRMRKMTADTRWVGREELRWGLELRFNTVGKPHEPLRLKDAST